VALQQLGGRLSGVAHSGSALYEDALFLEDFNSFLDLAPVVAAARPQEPAPGGFSTLTLDHVSFAYPGTERLALDDVSFEIHAGEVVALVGENGSGKTTLAKLLCHLYMPTLGRILWDGVDTAGCDPVTVRRHMAVIFQDFVQYHLSARDNVGVGAYERVDDLEAVAGAARQSGAHSFLETLPEGYETMLGREFDGGHELSVGQWQRVALARAFFRGAPFVLLDEPTAALDPRAEHELFERIRTMARGRTVLLVSHRFSSVRSADRIFVLGAGKLVEHGTHAELLAKGGQYAALFNLQAAAYMSQASS
jgi:ATP-binding cassette subfamily B protein